MFITLGIVVVAAVALVFIAQWLRSLDPVANFIATYDGTPTHPAGVEAGVPGWVGWKHFLNFFIIVMVLRSGFIIRNQQRPEAYWTPNQGGLYSPKRNAPQKVSIQQWIHQTFNILWVANGLIFYVMVFATGHWMRIVPTNWDIFPNMVSAGIQYVSLDWPEEHSWVYYNALQLLTYFITIFIAAPIAIISGLRLSTWWPQQAKRLNKAFSLEAARKIHFVTMLYFVVFIVVHLFLVFTTGVLSNLNMMFTARNADDWLGIGVFALSVAVTVGVAWLIKPIFISPIAEKTGQVSTR
ncbi:MAG TPA: cytochrome b/b6 domain-containing protein [Candidatus Yaniella excrementigallinarum]|nr:cytochrome b/b6 domain-containing protein [Candidatus Yaniella excrementigallinarum]